MELVSLDKYKTAYCPLHKFYVEIKKVIPTPDGRNLIVARPQDSNITWAFYEEELTDFVL